MIGFDKCKSLTATWLRRSGPACVSQDSEASGIPLSPLRQSIPGKAPIKALLLNFLCILCGLTVAIPTALSYELVRQPFDENVRDSDLVVIGAAISGRHVGNDGDSYVTIKVKDVLKGEAGPFIELSMDLGEVEFSPRCCTRGATYLLLLKKIGPNRYESVNGRFGVHKIGLCRDLSG
jgi:hypothetical protein